VPNAIVRANARPMSEATNRRAILGAIVTAGAVSALPAAAAFASPGPALTPADQRALDLWKRARRLLAIQERLGEEYDAAEAAMPSWARGGPTWVYPDGRPADEGEVGWPMVADLAQEPVCSISGLILARPQVESLYDRWSRDVRIGDRETATREVEIRVDGEEGPVMRLYRATLAAIRPQISGPIAEDADRALAERDDDGSGTNGGQHERPIRPRRR
jgi:hypothetical protein